MRTFLVAAWLGLTAGLAPAQFAPPPPVEEQVSRLRAEVAELRGAVARIEARLTHTLDTVPTLSNVASNTGSVSLARTVAPPVNATNTPTSITYQPQATQGVLPLYYVPTNPPPVQSYGAAYRTTQTTGATAAARPSSFGTAAWAAVGTPTDVLVAATSGSTRPRQVFGGG